MGCVQPYFQRLDTFRTYGIPKKGFVKDDNTLVHFGMPASESLQKNMFVVSFHKRLKECNADQEKMTELILTMLTQATTRRCFVEWFVNCSRCAMIHLVRMNNAAAEKKKKKSLKNQAGSEVESSAGTP